MQRFMKGKNLSLSLRRLLAEQKEMDEERRQIIFKLLAEEEAKVDSSQPMDIGSGFSTCSLDRAVSNAGNTNNKDLQGSLAMNIIQAAVPQPDEKKPDRQREFVITLSDRSREIIRLFEELERKRHQQAEMNETKSRFVRSKKPLISVFTAPISQLTARRSYDVLSRMRLSPILAGISRLRPSCCWSSASIRAASARLRASSACCTSCQWSAGCWR
jgi:hypothetical protein